MSQRRALHFVFKIGNREEAVKFFRDVLGMQFLRHEEFKKGCDAACNGPYDGRWSKTMVGYGSEDKHFVLELTYNYGISSYEMGNDFQYITINSDQILNNAAQNNWPVTPCKEGGVLIGSGGYKFVIKNKSCSGDPVQNVVLASSNLEKSINFWHNKLNMNIYNHDDRSVTMGYADNQVKLELIGIGEPVRHAKAFGRIAFSCPQEQLPIIEKIMKESGEKILTPLIALDTPGKTTVEVVILADPDGHEICFVGDEAFRELSQLDPKAYRLLEEALAADKSDEWFAKRGLSKEALKTD